MHKLSGPLEIFRSHSHVQGHTRHADYTAAQLWSPHSHSRSQPSPCCDSARTARSRNIGPTDDSHTVTRHADASRKRRSTRRRRCQPRSTHRAALPGHACTRHHNLTQGHASKPAAADREWPSTRASLSTLGASQWVATSDHDGQGLPRAVAVAAMTKGKSVLPDSDRHVLMVRAAMRGDDEHGCIYIGNTCSGNGSGGEVDSHYAVGAEVDGGKERSVSSKCGDAR